MSILNVNKINPVGGGSTITIAGIASVTGNVTATSFIGNGSGLTNLAADLVNDTSPQLGGNLDTNSFEISLDDGHNINFGDGADCTMNHSGADFAIINTTGNLNILNNSDQAVQIRHGSETMIKAISDGAVELYHNGTKQCETSASGIAFPSGKGIDFSAYSISGDQGTSSSSVLDDFEEGDWTCTLSGSSGGSITATRACYTKVGNMVMCEATFVNPGNNSVSGNWSMSLPFQFIGSGSGAYGGGKVTYTRYVPGLTSGFQSYTIFTYHGQGVCYLYKLGTNGSSESQWMGGSVNNNLLFSFTMTYTTGT